MAMAAVPPRTALAVAVLVSLASLAAASSGWIVQGTADNGAALLRKSSLKNTIFEHMLTGSPDPDNLYQKAARMANETAFVFYRGNARLYYPDIKSQDVVSGSKFYSEEARVWIQGDLHMLNMGTFADNTDTTIFDGNDFDEAWPASYLYDVYRCAASIVLVAYDNQLTQPDAKDLVRAFAKAYIKQVEAIYDKPKIGAKFELTADNADGYILKLLKKKGAETRKGMLDEWTTPSRVFDGEGVRAADIVTRTELGDSGIPTKLKPDNGKPPTQAWLTSVNAYLKSLRDDIDVILKPGTMDAYRKTLYDPDEYSKSKYDAYFALKDVAVRIEAGLGSFGTNRFYVLIEGETKGPDDDRLLDVKIQNAPSITGSMLPSETNGTLLFGGNNALRTVYGQRATLIANNPSKDYKVDIHLGFMVLAGGNYSVRERSPNKGALTKYIANSASPLGKDDLQTIVEQYGQVMAADHARSDNDTPFNVESRVINTCFECVVHGLMKGYKPGDFADDIAAFAIPYADQVKVDQDLWKEMVQEGAFTTIDTMARKKPALPPRDELR